MGDQLGLFSPGSGGRETITKRLLSRRDDPPTSKAAAKLIASKLTRSQFEALSVVQWHGPGTAMELAKKNAAYDFEVHKLYHRLARRLPELERQGLVETTGEIRQGARVWRAKEA